MPSDHSLKIVSFGLIGEAQNGSLYRSVVFQDTRTGKQADFIVYKKRRPSLWADIEELEKGKNMPPYQGTITRYQGVDLVVLANNDLEESLEEQKWKLGLIRKISYVEAERMRKESMGYSTDLTCKGCLEVGWRKIDKTAQKIRFRYYQGKGIFSWSRWFDLRG
ncbi:MAG: hypothetical protein JW801_17300 [Bacteroidales bacterium]|nr:hypothetical protein [Bacteroidales bacterium]